MEKITYRAAVRGGRSGSFLPVHGIGSGLDDPALGFILNRVAKSPSKFRTTHRIVTGIVVADDADYVTIEQSDGRWVRVSTSDVIERTKMPRTCCANLLY
jgi:hypothetical protein